MTDKEQKKWHEEKWGENEEPKETPTERPHRDDDSIKNQDKEQIIIDGVDVSDCKDIYCGTNCGNTGASCPDIKCKNNPNWYFKQLARKTQEYQKLADILRNTDTYSEVCSDCRDDILLYPSISGKTSYIDNEIDRITLSKIINELKYKTQECEELKAEKEAIKKYLGISDKSIMQRLEELTEYKLKRQLKYMKIEEECDQYLKSLEEIEQIVKSFNKNELCFYKEINECDCCDMGADCNYLRRAKILYIINTAKEKSDGQKRNK